LINYPELKNKNITQNIVTRNLKKFCEYYNCSYENITSHGASRIRLTKKKLIEETPTEEIHPEEIIAEEKPQVIGNRLVKNDVEEANEWDSLQNKIL
jgi:hypothetical protein